MSFNKGDILCFAYYACKRMQTLQFKNYVGDTRVCICSITKGEDIQMHGNKVPVISLENIGEKDLNAGNIQFLQMLDSTL